MSDYDLITEAKKFHKELCDENRVIESIYQGLTVYKVNLAIRGDIKKNEINSNDYFFSESTIKKHNVNITAERFREQVSSTNKKGICLHYTVAPIRSALRHLTGVIEYYEDGITIKKEQWTSVPFMICHAGNIYQLSNPDTDLSWHLSPRIYGGDSIWLHNQIIGIELCNWGTDVQNVTDSSHIITLPQEYRGKTRFETFTEEQYVSLNKLIDAICSKYDQIERKILPEEERYIFFKDSKNDIRDKELSNRILSWRGISSHVNYNWEKWDIGPAFDWDRLVSLPICHPYGGNKPSTQWFFSTELRGQGGYYPFGMNGAMHNGFHVFSKERLQEVKAIAPGYIIAFRYVRENPQIEGVASSKADSFVLMKHDADVTEGSGEQKSKTQKSFYSMYMDLESIDENDLKKISWIKKLNTFCTETKVSTGYEDLGDRIETDENSFKREAHEKLKEIKFTPIENDILVDITVNNEASKIITLSEPYLYVEAGETIGYSLTKRKNQSTENFMHLEVFTTEEEAYSAIVKASGLEQDNSLETMRIDPAQSFLNAGDRGTYFGGTFTSILGTFLNSDKQTYGEVVSTHYSQGAAA